MIDILYDILTKIYQNKVLINIVISFAILIITVIIASYTKKHLTHISEKEEFFNGEKRYGLLTTSRTRFAIIRRLIIVVIYVFGIILAIRFIPGLEDLSLSLLAGAGVLTVIIGFATQKALGNIISGIFIAIFEPFRVSDRIKIGEEYGVVEDISLQNTILRLIDNTRVIIPNAVLTDEKIYNYSIKDPREMCQVTVTISYDSSIKRAKEILLAEALKNDKWIEKPGSPDTVRVIELGELGVKLRLYTWTKDKPDSWKMEKEILEAVKYRFDEEGIEIPYPRRIIIQK